MKKKKKRFIDKFLMAVKKSRGYGTGSLFIILIILGFSALGYIYVGGFPTLRGGVDSDEFGYPIVSGAPENQTAPAVSGSPAPISSIPGPTISK